MATKILLLDIWLGNKTVSSKRAGNSTPVLFYKTDAFSLKVPLIRGFRGLGTTDFFNLRPSYSIRNFIRLKV